MRVNQVFPPPIHGVSTLAPVNRLVGQAQLQENFRSDPAAKLTKRASLEWKTRMVTALGNKLLKHHEYRRSGNVYELLVLTTGVVYGFVNDVPVTVNSNLSSYITSHTNINLTTINDTTFVCDKTVPVEVEPDTDYTEGNARRIHHLNFVKALSYSEKVTVTITRRSNSTSIVADYQAPNLNPSLPGAADEGRGTSFSATELYADILVQLAASPTFPCSVALNGSTIAFWNTADNDWFDVTLSTGSGVDSVKHFGESIAGIEGLPKFAVDKTVYKVVPSKQSDDGVFYIKSTRISPSITDLWPSGSPRMFEVVWEESRAPNETYTFKQSTMPHTIIYDHGTGEFTCGVSPILWDDRQTGDAKSNAFPGFVGVPIENIGYFQNRLCLLSDNTIYMSETDNLYNWFKQSALQLVVSDPCAISSNAKGIDGLKHMINHNRDLMVVAANGQFKITGDAAVTPQTVSMVLTTAYECQVSVAPVGIGNAVYLPVSYGNSSGLSSYTGEPNTSQDSAQPVTAHVVGYMKGAATTLVASSNLEMLIMRTTGCAHNEMFVLEQARAPNGVLQQLAWCKWVLPETTDIIDITINNDVISIVCLDDGDIVKKVIQLHSAIAQSTQEIFLDDRLTLTSNGLTATIPTGYDMTGKIVVRGTGCNYELFEAEYTVAGSTITFDESIADTTCTVYVGTPFTAKYIPTRPFLYDKDTGRPDTKDRIRVNRFILQLVDTHQIKAKIHSLYNTFDDQTFISRVLGNISSFIGEKTFFTGDAKFSFSHGADEATIEFVDSGYLSTTIAGISWEGQLYKSSKLI